MLRKALLPFLIAVPLTLSACGVPTINLGATAARPDVQPPAVAQAQPATAPTAVTSRPVSPQPVTSKVAPAVLQAANGQIRLAVVPSDSNAQYRVREQLARFNFPNDAVGTTKDVSGQIVLDSNGKLVAGQSKFTVGLRSLQSDSRSRDRYVQGNTLQTSTYPTAEFVPTQIVGLSTPLPTSGQVKFQLVGDLTVHGTSHPTTWDVTAQVDGQDLKGSATTNVKFEDFGMTPPQDHEVLSVADNLGLVINFHLSLQQG